MQQDEFSKIIYWAGNGAEFVIKDTSKFQQIVLPRYFRHNKMNSFIRQLNMYGFHKSRGDHSKCVFSHPDFLRDREYQSADSGICSSPSRGKSKIRGITLWKPLENHH